MIRQGLYRILQILSPPEKPMWDNKKEMVQIEARELEWLRQQAAMNPSRGQIICDYRLHDDKEKKQDPEYAEFNQYLEGTKFLEENAAKKLINNWIKLRELIENIAQEYYSAFYDDLNPDYSVHFDFLIDIEHGAIRVEWTSTWEDQVSVPRGTGNFYLPMELLWSDWKKICRDKITERQAAAKAQQQADQEKWEKYDRERREMEYQRAKELVEKYEKRQEP